MDGVIMNRVYVKGIFIEEAKKRFLCSVKIDGNQELCYIASSSKLSHFICLQGREVLLKKNIGSNNRTKYTLYAVKTENGFALLNLVHINKLLLQEFNKSESMYSNLGKIYPEKKINDTLKVDFLIEGDKVILIEAKGVLTEDQTAKFPAMRVTRAEKQLLQFEKLLKKGIDIHYYLVLMDAEIKSVELDLDNKEFIQPFKRCIRKGMKLYIYRTVWQEEFTITRDYELEANLNKSILLKHKNA